MNVSARARRRGVLEDQADIPEADARRLTELGVAAVYTPKDFGLTEIMGGIVDVIRKAHDLD